MKRRKLRALGVNRIVPPLMRVVVILGFYDGRRTECNILLKANEPH